MKDKFAVPRNLSATWKMELEKVMDNPHFIEENIRAILLELQKDRPDTNYLREKARNINTWIGEIDLAHRRAIEKSKKVI